MYDALRTFKYHLWLEVWCYMMQILNVNTNTHASRIEN